jgi:translation initiation factor 2B subunit (eIF-2B alpha/beta/delta family)
MQGKITLNSIINDKVSGSSELLEMLNDYLLQNADNFPKMKRDLYRIKNEIRGFAAINNYIRKIDKLITSGDKKTIKTFLTRFNSGKIDSYTDIYNKANSYLSKFDNILTLSNSKTLLEVIKLWSKSNNKLEITVCESGPKNEGVIFAKALAKENIKINLITDASMSDYIAKVDAVLVGADIILGNGNVINKTGSRNAAIICRYFGKPFIVLATKDKFTNKRIYKPGLEKPGEILNGNIKNIKVYNYYFEEIDKSLITKVFTEE